MPTGFENKPDNTDYKKKSQLVILLSIVTLILIAVGWILVTRYNFQQINKNVKDQRQEINLEEIFRKVGDYKSANSYEATN